MAKKIRWHKEGREDDGNSLRHLVDSIVWKEFDKRHEWFVSDSCNVRLGLASDGVVPRLYLMKGKSEISNSH